MTLRSAKSLLLLIPLLLLAACDSGSTATPTLVTTGTATAVATSSAAQTATPAVPVAVATSTVATSGQVVTAVPTSQSPAQDTAVVAQPTSPPEGPSATVVSATATGNAITALVALAQLKPKALAWQPDARLVMLANVRPGQADKLLSVALGDPTVNEPTPGGLGRDWALIVFSPSTKGAIALSSDGSQADLVQEGALTDSMVQSLGSSDMEALDLSKLDLSKLVDSDKLPPKAGATGQLASSGIALLAPNGLGLGPLPTPTSDGASPEIAYELFSADPNQQNFVFFDATTGEVIMDSTAP